MSPVMSPDLFYSVILSAAKDARMNLWHRWRGFFAAPRMTGCGRVITVAMLALLGLAKPACYAETFAESGRAAHGMLTRLCDDFGGRVTGSAANNGALERLAEELKAVGLKPEKEEFSMPGW